MISKLSQNGCFLSYVIDIQYIKKLQFSFSFEHNPC